MWLRKECSLSVFFFLTFCIICIIFKIQINDLCLFSLITNLTNRCIKQFSRSFMWFHRKRLLHRFLIGKNSRVSHRESLCNTYQFAINNNDQLPRIVWRVCDFNFHRNVLGNFWEMILTRFPMTDLVGKFRYRSDVELLPRPKLQPIAFSWNIFCMSLFRQLPYKYGRRYGLHFLAVLLLSSVPVLQDSNIGSVKYLHCLHTNGVKKRSIGHHMTDHVIYLATQSICYPW